MSHSVQPDAFFIEQVMQGSSEAFAVLVERYLPVARAVALAQTRNLDDADDVAQEALLKAYTSLGRLRDRKRFGAWLATITRNVALSSLRQQARQAAATHSAQGEPWGVVCGSGICVSSLMGDRCPLYIGGVRCSGDDREDGD